MHINDSYMYSDGPCLACGGTGDHQWKFRPCDICEGSGILQWEEPDKRREREEESEITALRVLTESFSDQMDAMSEACKSMAKELNEYAESDPMEEREDLRRQVLNATDDLDKARRKIRSIERERDALREESKEAHARAHAVAKQLLILKEEVKHQRYPDVQFGVNSRAIDYEEPDPPVLEIGDEEIHKLLEEIEDPVPVDNNDIIDDNDIPF